MHSCTQNHATSQIPTANCLHHLNAPCPHGHPCAFFHPLTVAATNEDMRRDRCHCTRTENKRLKRRGFTRSIRHALKPGGGGRKLLSEKNWVFSSEASAVGCFSTCFLSFLSILGGTKFFSSSSGSMMSGMADNLFPPFCVACS